MCIFLVCLFSILLAQKKVMKLCVFTVLAITCESGVDSWGGGYHIKVGLGGGGGGGGVPYICVYIYISTRM